MSQTKPLYDVRKICNLRDMLEQSTNLFGGNNAFIIKAKDNSKYIGITYKEFKSKVDYLGTSLVNCNLAGNRIAIISENRHEWAISYFAVVNGTGIGVPIDKSLPDDEIERIIVRSGVKAIIYSRKYYNLMKEIANRENSLEVFICMDNDEDDENILSFQKLIVSGKSQLENGDNRFVDSKINNEEMALMLYTSGTSDIAKAVMLSHKNVCSNIMGTSSVFKVYENDVFLSMLPLHHSYEATCGFLCPIYAGATITYCEGLKHIPKNLKEYKVTVMCSVPLIYEHMYKKIIDEASKKSGMLNVIKLIIIINNLLRKTLKINLSRKVFKKVHEAVGGHIRVFLSGAAGIDPKVAKGFRDFGIHFIQGYGLTECSPLVTANTDKDFKDDATGLPLPELDVRIVKENESDDFGEIIVKGSSVMIGYYDNVEATNQVLKDGWFYSGDLGNIDKDGFVHITGRKKNVIVMKNGKNVFPEEIEGLLNRSHYIKETIVWGKEDENGETKICASIVLDSEFFLEKFASRELSQDEIYEVIDNEIKMINKKMPLYKYIREFSIRETEFIKTTTQKIKRYMESVEKDKSVSTY